MRAASRGRAAAVAAVGAALLALGLSAPGVGASAAPLPIYSAGSIGRGVETTVAVVPHVFRPLVHGSVAFVRSELESVPVSSAVASQFYPGDFAQYVAGPEGPVVGQGFPAAYPLTVIARYPDRPRAATGFPQEVPPLDERGLIVRGATLAAEAGIERNSALVSTGDVTVKPLPGDPPAVGVSELSVTTDAASSGGRISQTTVARASGISLFGGQIVIERVVSTARAVSDGTGVPEILADVAIGRVWVKDTAGARRAARIDRTGIHIEDPSLSRDLNQGLDQSLQYALGRAGVKIAVLDETRVTDGPLGTATAGGLVVSWTTGPCDVCKIILSAMPGVPQPPLPEGTPYPLCILPDPTLPCVSTALVPFPPGTLEGTITIAGVRAQAYGGLEEAFAAPGGGAPGSSPDVLGAHYERPTAGGTDGSAAPSTEIASFGAPPAPRAPLFGLVAEMPDGALAGAGAALLVLAVGLVLGPSLRREPA